MLLNFYSRILFKSKKFTFTSIVNNCQSWNKMGKQTMTMNQLIKSKINDSYQEIPLIVIIGATGCGKTKLSIQLAKKYGGEVISADSMQIYKGLDIATNKATIEEQSNVLHHLLDIIDPFKQFTVLDFQRNAMEKIEVILKRGNIPIIVGGTNYYIESILWDTLVGSVENFGDQLDIIPQKENQDEDNHTKLSSIPLSDSITTLEDLWNYEINYKNLSLVSSQLLHALLEKLDPISAKTLHPHNKRKIVRCLQVYQQTGKLFSDILAKQRKIGSRHGGPLRFSNSIILWVDCEKEVLDKRLDNRVDQMLELGLLKELKQFHKDYNDRRLRENRKADYTEGIFQAIGLKEFHNYLLLNEEEKESYDGSLVLGNGILSLKQRTKAYVTKQLKWIRRRFLVSDSIRNVPNVYRLDTTFPDRWDIDVLDKSIRIVDLTIEALASTEERIRIAIWNESLNPLAAARLENDEDLDDSFISGQFYCDICQCSVSGGKSYQMHLNSKGHKFMAKQS